MNNYRKVKGKNEIILQPEEIYEESYEVLEPEVYKLWDAGNMFTGMIPMFEIIREKDKLVKFKSGVVQEVVAITNKFLGKDSREVYKELKITHKMGMLFYGKQGTGKTSTCMLIMKELSDTHKAICLDCTGKTLRFVRECIRRIREIQKNPIVVFVDEFESSIRGEEEQYLTFLDGNDSIDNLIFIGCTNYLEKIPDRIKKRKSRIKYLRDINSLPIGVYREYLSNKIPSMNIDLVAKFSYLASEKGLTIDQFKHALIDYKLEDISMEKAVKAASKFNDNGKYDDAEEDETEDDNSSNS